MTCVRSYKRQISIHAPHARSDIIARSPSDCQPISIHAPHARSDKKSTTLLQRPLSFQSTLLMRGATEEQPQSRGRCQDFNPRSSCEERQYRQGLLAEKKSNISIHAPHARSDADAVNFPDQHVRFQSTLLMRGATVSLSSIDLLDFIIDFSRTPHLFPKTLLLTLCPVSSISCVMALRA